MVVPERVVHYVSAAVLGPSVCIVFSALGTHAGWYAGGFQGPCLVVLLMASAHGAGLMLVPILLQWPAQDDGHARLITTLSPQVIANSPPC